MKRVKIRTNGKTHLEPEATKLYGLRDEDVVGWFANKHNIASGWVLLDTTSEEKAEFGDFALRSYSYNTETTSIIKINPQTGTYAFLDNEAYLNGEIKYEKMEAYNRLILDNKG